MPTTALVNIAILIVLMAVMPFIWPAIYPVRPWVALLVLVVAAVLAVAFGAKWRRRGWDTDASRKIT